jgi:hypothetical protein
LFVPVVVTSASKVVFSAMVVIYRAPAAVSAFSARTWFPASSVRFPSPLSAPVAPA